VHHRARHKALGGCVCTEQGLTGKGRGLRPVKEAPDTSLLRVLQLLSCSCLAPKVCLILFLLPTSAMSCFPIFLPEEDQPQRQDRVQCQRANHVALA